MTDNWNTSIKRVRVPFGSIAASPLSLVQKQMAGLLDDFFPGFIDPFSTHTNKGASFLPRLEISEDEQGLTLRAEVPGMTVEDVEITLTKKEITLRGERRDELVSKEGATKKSEWLYGSFERTVPLFFDVDEDHVDASVKDGILSIRLPKTTQAKLETKKVSIRKG